MLEKIAPRQNNIIVHSLRFPAEVLRLSDQASVFVYLPPRAVGRVSVSLFVRGGGLGSPRIL